jgi:hypothetical protein
MKRVWMSEVKQGKQEAIIGFYHEFMLAIASTPFCCGVGMMAPHSFLGAAQHPPYHTGCTRGGGTHAACFSRRRESRLAEVHLLLCLGTLYRRQDR